MNPQLEENSSINPLNAGCSEVGFNPSASSKSTNFLLPVKETELAKPLMVFLKVSIFLPSREPLISI